MLLVIRRNLLLRRGHVLREGDPFRFRVLLTSLRDNCRLSGCLLADAVDRPSLGRDLVVRGFDREPIVSVIDHYYDVAGVDVGVVLNQDAGQVA
jgi:hypothetical protein